MSSSRKDYVAIAAIIKATAPDAEYALIKQWAAGANATREAIARQAADHFAADNPAFDRARFLKACGVAS